MAVKGDTAIACAAEGAPAEFDDAAGEATVTPAATTVLPAVAAPVAACCDAADGGGGGDGAVVAVAVPNAAALFTPSLATGSLLRSIGDPAAGAVFGVAGDVSAAASTGFSCRTDDDGWTVNRAHTKHGWREVEDLRVGFAETRKIGTGIAN